MQPQSQPKLVGGKIDYSGMDIFYKVPMACNYVEQDSSDEDLGENETFQINHQNAKHKLAIEKESKNKMDEKMDKSSKQLFFERAKQIDEDEIVILAGAEKTGKQIYEHETQDIPIFPAFTLITNEEKGKINSKRYILWSMLNPYNRPKAKEQLIKLVNQINNGTLIEQFKQSSTQGGDCFQWYSKQCFYHKVINKGLRAFKSPDEYYYLRLIFSDLFTTILNKYQTEKHDGFFCWRKSHMAKEQISKLKANIGEYIELQGFISTSKDLQKVKNFKGNVLFKIEVPAKTQGDLNRELNNGYADISNQSWYKSQSEILFNAINYFKINGVQKIKDEQLQYKIFLRYDPLQMLKNKKQRKQKQLWKNHTYQYMKAMNIRNQGDCFFECGQYQKCLYWFELKLDRISKSFQKKFGGNIQSSKFYDSRQQKKQLYHDYFSSLFMKVSCRNNLKEYEKAESQIIKCQNFYNFAIGKKDENYAFILKTKGKILLNCGKTEEGKEILNDLLQTSKIEVKQKIKKKKIQIEWGSKKRRVQFKNQILAILKFWKDCKKLNLVKGIENELQELETTRGKNNVFYLTSLKNKFIILHQQEKWTKITEQFEKIKEYLKQIPEVKSTDQDVKFFHYVVCLSYLQLEKIQEAEIIFTEFTDNLDRKKILFCQEMTMFFELLNTFFWKTRHQKYFTQLTKILKHGLCYSDNFEEQTEFKSKKDLLRNVLQGQLKKKLQNFTVERTFEKA